MTMDTSLYVSNKKIQLIHGQMKGSTVQIEDFAEVPMPSQAFLNGTVTDETAFKLAIEQVVTKSTQPDIKDVRISIGSCKAMVKTKEIPAMKPQMVWKWLEDEVTEDLGDDEESTDYLKDYSLIEQSDEGVKALIAAVPREMIGQYVRLFDEMNITVSCIDLGMSSMIKLVDSMPKTEHKTFIMITADGGLLTGALFIDGIYRMYARARLLSEPDSEDESMEIDQMESRIIQFNFTEKNPDKVEFVYPVGFSRKQKEFLSRNSSVLVKDIGEDAAGVVEYADPDFKLDAYACATGNLIRE